MKSLFSTTLRKFTAKIMALSLMATLLAPVSNGFADGTGTLQVTVDPSTGMYNILDGSLTPVNPNPLQGNQIFANIAQGSYVVDFLPIGDYENTPESALVTIGSGDFKEVIGIYTNNPEPEPGMLIVNVDPVAATYNVLDGSMTPIEGSPFQGHKTFGNLAQGSYIVQFLPYLDYVLPDPDMETIMMAPGVIETINGVYTLPTTNGTLRVEVDLADAQYNVLDGSMAPIENSPFTGNNIIGNLPQGSYTVEFIKYSDEFTTPETQTVTVLPESEVLVIGHYEFIPANGTLIVIVNPSYAIYDVLDGGMTPIEGSPFQ